MFVFEYKYTHTQTIQSLNFFTIPFKIATKFNTALQLQVGSTIGIIMKL